MSVVHRPGNHVPMHVRRHIAETRKVDLVRLEQAAQRLLNGEYHPHAVILPRAAEIGHLPDVLVPDHPAEAGVIRVRDQHHATELVAP